MSLDVRRVFSVTDEATSGKWFDVGNGARLLVAKFGNERHQHVRRRLTKPWKNVPTIPEDVEVQIAIEAAAETILLGWDGIEENGQPVPYSQAKAKEYLKIKDFQTLVLSLALDHNNFNDGTDEKNSVSSPGGGSEIPAG